MVDHDAGFGSAAARSVAAAGAEPTRLGRGSDDALVTGLAPAAPADSPAATDDDRTADAVAGAATAGRGFLSELLDVLLDDCKRTGAAAVTRMLAVTGCGVRSRATACDATADVADDCDSRADVASDDVVSLEVVSDDVASLSATDSCFAFAVHPVVPAAQTVASISERVSDCFMGFSKRLWPDCQVWSRRDCFQALAGAATHTRGTLVRPHASDAASRGEVPRFLEGCRRGGFYRPGIVVATVTGNEPAGWRILARQLAEQSGRGFRSPKSFYPAG